MITKIEHSGVLYATIFSGFFTKPGVNFLTPDEASLQVGLISHPAGKKIKAHIHITTVRNLYYTHEVLIIRKGKLRIDFYDAQKRYLESRILSTGDIALLESGGHGFEVLEDIELIEIKQGPYVAGADKDRFEGIDADDAKIMK